MGPDDDTAEQVRVELRNYLLAPAAHRRDHPAGETISAFVHEPEPALRLTPEEPEVSYGPLLIAGHETAVKEHHGDALGDRHACDIQAAPGRRVPGQRTVLCPGCRSAGAVITLHGGLVTQQFPTVFVNRSGSPRNRSTSPGLRSSVSTPLVIRPWLRRPDNAHLGFGSGGYLCDAPLPARVEAGPR
ncbi:hypothetical protein [Streptomyces sp. NPDC027717]|uniref:hypothetical protein n=1 Tax=Streptomyces sp. NPDC027717 TaxID=3155765 RepID=UPI00340157D0